MDGELLYQRNLEVLAEHFPEAHAALTALTEPQAKLVWDGTACVDIAPGGGNTLYGGDARLRTAEQVEAYLAKPIQVGYVVPSANNYDSLFSRAIHQGVVDSLARWKVEELPLRPSGRTGFAFILGVGLGYHLPALIEKLGTPHIVLCEPFDEFLRASLHAIDWGALLKRCAELGKTLLLVRSPTIEGLSEQVFSIIGKVGQHRLDGSYFYEHYPLWMLQELRRRLVNELPRQMMSLGYFEDERKMVRNAAVNLHRCGFKLLDGGKFRQRGDVPVLLVGAGPSIDETIGIVKELSDRAVVFSSGTALQVCLANGIIPDFHTEIENTYDCYEKVKFILEKNEHLFPDGKFKGIRLVGSATVNPQLPPLFDDVYFYLREVVSSTTSFGRGFGPMNGVAPVVANTSLAVAARMGFGDIYLFGFDCGWRDESAHHTKDSIYYTADRFKDHRLRGELSYPGNFGGTIYSNTVFEWSRSMLMQAISSFHLSVYNCSDGARIEGATPKVAEAVVLPEGIDRETFLAEVEADAKAFSPGEFFRDHDFNEYLDEIDWYVSVVGGTLDSAMAERQPYEDFSDRFMDLMRELRVHPRYRIAGLLHFSVRSAIPQANLFFSRLDNDSQRLEVAQDFYKVLRGQLDMMAGEGRQIIREIQEWVAGGPEPKWILGMPTMPGHSY